MTEVAVQLVRVGDGAEVGFFSLSRVPSVGEFISSSCRWEVVLVEHCPGGVDGSPAAAIVLVRESGKPTDAPHIRQHQRDVAALVQRRANNT